MVSKGKLLFRSVRPSGKLLESLTPGGQGIILGSSVPLAAMSHPCQAEPLESVRHTCSPPFLPFPLVPHSPAPARLGAARAALWLSPLGILCSFLHSCGLLATSDPEAPFRKPRAPSEASCCSLWFHDGSFGTLSAFFSSCTQGPTPSLSFLVSETGVTKARFPRGW